MIFFDTIKTAFFSLLLLLALFFAAPVLQTGLEVGMIIVICVLFFAALAIFFMIRLSKRYDNMRNEMAKEDAYWVTIFRTSTLLGQRFTDKMTDIIDRYYMAVYDGEIGATYQQSEEEVLNAYRAINEASVREDHVSQTALSELVTMLEKVEVGRNKISVLADERLSRGHWLVMYILAVLIIVGLYVIDRSNFFMQVSAVLISIALIIVLLIMRDLQDFNFGGKILMEESGEQVFESIGKLRYYNVAFLKEKTVIVPKRIKRYRLGRLDAKGKRVITVVTRK